MVAAIGPMASGSGKAMAPLLSQGNLATMTPSSTNPDLTDPKFAAQYRPAGKTIYFRTVTTDAFQGPNMANFMADKLKVKSVFVLDDTGAYGVGLADAFQAQAAKRGMTVLGRDRVDPLASDYRPILTKIKSLNAQSMYCGSSALAGVKLVKQSYDIMPDIIKAGGDGMHQQSVLAGAGFPAAENWYSTIAAPHMLDDAKLSAWLARFQKRWGNPPSDYAITSYDAALVVLAAIETVAKTGEPVTRDAVRDAIQAGTVDTLQGTLSYDANGDLRHTSSASSRCSTTPPIRTTTRCTSSSISAWRWPTAPDHQSLPPPRDRPQGDIPGVVDADDQQQAQGRRQGRRTPGTSAPCQASRPRPPRTDSRSPASPRTRPDRPNRSPVLNPSRTMSRQVRP